MEGFYVFSFSICLRNKTNVTFKGIFMTTKLYVGNLPYTFTEDDLKDLFSKFESMTSAKLIIDRDTNRSKGFGFVELDDNEANAAIEEFNEKEFDGRKIIVNEARPQEKRPSKGKFFSKRR
jgi:RNA recognition motif-containing protein